MIAETAQIEKPPTENIESKKRQYLNSMTELERRAYEIAKNHLRDSFCIEKSNGYKSFFSEKK